MNKTSTEGVGYVLVDDTLGSRGGETVAGKKEGGRGGLKANSVNQSLKRKNDVRP